MTTKQWIIRRFPRRWDVCDWNQEAGAIPSGEPFPSGHMGPPAHFNCGCILSTQDPTRTAFQVGDRVVVRGDLTQIGTVEALIGEDSQGRIFFVRSDTMAFAGWIAYEFDLNPTSIPPPRFSIGQRVRIIGAPIPEGGIVFSYRAADGQVWYDVHFDDGHIIPVAETWLEAI